MFIQVLPSVLSYLTWTQFPTIHTEKSETSDIHKLEFIIT